MRHKSYKKGLITNIVVMLGLLCISGCMGTIDWVQLTPPELPSKVFKPSSGMSKVVFVKTGRAVGGALGNIYDGPDMIGQVIKNSFFQYECKPGKRFFGYKMHVINPAAMPYNFVEAELLPDRVYYINVVNLLAGKKGVNRFSIVRPLYEGCQHDICKDWHKLLKNLPETTLTPKFNELVARDKKRVDDWNNKHPEYQYTYESNLEDWKKDINVPKFTVLPEYGYLEPIKF